MWRVNLCAAWLLIPSLAFAFEVTISGGVFQLTGDEPATNSNGQPLADLDRIEAAYSIETLGIVDQGRVGVAASSPVGGQPFHVEITVPEIANFDGEIEFRATACDAAKAAGRAPLDNCSDPAIELKRIDLLAPGTIE